MDNWHVLNIELQIEMLITEREGMIAANQQRIHRGESLAWEESNFQGLNDQFARLLEDLKKEVER